MQLHANEHWHERLVSTRLVGAWSAGGGSGASGCFAGQCDWRLPTVDELSAIFDSGIPGEERLNPYWTSTTDTSNPTVAWQVNMLDGSTPSSSKGFGFFVRAVRGGF